MIYMEPYSLTPNSIPRFDYRDRYCESFRVLDNSMSISGLRRLIRNRLHGFIPKRYMEFVDMRFLVFDDGLWGVWGYTSAKDSI